jgi:hypothetical protein
MVIIPATVTAYRATVLSNPWVTVGLFVGFFRDYLTFSEVLFDLPLLRLQHNMGKKSVIPNAWDDDWETQADRTDGAVAVEEQVKISKAERLAKHAEINKQIWESAYICSTSSVLSRAITNCI